VVTLTRPIQFAACKANANTLVEPEGIRLVAVEFVYVEPVEHLVHRRLTPIGRLLEDVVGRRGKLVPLVHPG
jgi:hypothetical protein